MSDRSRQQPGRSGPYGFSSVPAPASATASEFQQSPVQEDIINTTKQSTYDTGYIDPNFGYAAPLAEDNLGSQYGSEASRSSRDLNILERSTAKEESLLDLLDGSHTLDNTPSTSKTPKPKQLPEALKYLAPTPAQRNVSRQSGNTQSKLPQQPTPHKPLPHRQSPYDPNRHHQQVQSTQLVCCLPIS